MRLKAFLTAFTTAVLTVFAGAPALAQAPAGDAVCAQCHQPAVTSFALGKHAVHGDRRTPAGSGAGCQSCHTGATAHAADPMNVKPLAFGKGATAAEENAACASCHKGDRHIQWAGSVHERNDVTCTSCHNVHVVKDQALVSKTQAGVCFTCHKDVRASMFKASVHPLREGVMPCSSCHEPHGSVANFALKRNTINETCYTCHADKRGPFLWEHPPAREECTNCHVPHGSNNPSLLVQRMPHLCQQCHINPQHPSTLYSGAQLPGGPTAAKQSMLGQSCANCHTKVHGSNHPSGARFTR
jgi:DmsE family decaheme c-type cytochrome